MPYALKSIKDVEVRGKTVILRVDINSTVKGGKIVKGPKILEHAETIRKLMERGAKVVILSHQGRKGRDDFIDLSSHRKSLSTIIEKEIPLFKWNEDYISAIKKLKEGEAILMENTRFLEFENENLPPEEHAKNPVIKEMAAVGDIFVLDALSVAHRSHATVVGFTPLLPSYAGPVLKNELSAMKKINEVKDSTVLILGGIKPVDSLSVAEKMLESEKVSRVLLGGCLGELAIIAKGSRLGYKEQYLKEKGIMDSLPKVKELLEKYPDKICFPSDLAVRRYGKRVEISLAELPVDEDIFDVGEITVENYKRFINKADIVIFNGSFGVTEKYQFAFGTRKILSFLCHCRAFTLLGGGDTVTALVRLGFKMKEFGHVSLAGKALLKFLAGNNLPGLIALKKAQEKK